MKVALADRRQNPVLRREELTANVDYEGGATPSLAALRSELGKLLGVPEERIEVAKLLSTTGRTAGTAWVRVWEVAELVPKPKVKKSTESKG